LKLETNLNDTTELILVATNKKNNLIHPVMNEKPIEIVHLKPAEFERRISRKIKHAQEKTLDTVNKNRTYKDYQVSEKFFLKTNKRLGNKLSPLCSEETIEADLGTTVLIKGRVVHKDNLR